MNKQLVKNLKIEDNPGLFFQFLRIVWVGLFTQKLAFFWTQNLSTPSSGHNVAKDADCTCATFSWVNFPGTNLLWKVESNTDTCGETFGRGEAQKCGREHSGTLAARRCHVTRDGCRAGESPEKPPQQEVLIFIFFFPDLNQYSFESKAEPSCSSECKQVQLSSEALPIHGHLPWAIGPISEDIYTLSDNITGAATPPVCRCFKFKLICKRSRDFGTGWTNFG